MEIGIWIGIVLGVLSTACYSAAAVAQRRLAVALPEPLTGGRPLSRLLRHPLWWTSAVLNAGRAGLQVAALAFAPLTVVQPLGVLVLVFGLPWSARLGGRRVTPREWRGAVLTVLALALLLWAAVTGGRSRPMDAWTSAAVVVGALVLISGLAWAAGRASSLRMRSCLLGAGAGTAFGVASATTKTAIAVAAADGAAFLLHPAACGTAAIAVLGLLLAQAAYQGMELGAPLGVTAVANPVAASAVGVAFMGESYTAGWTGAGIAVLCGMLAAYGIALMSVPDGRLPARGGGREGPRGRRPARPGRPSRGRFRSADGAASARQEGLL
ncbi:DMT family transporter [Nocardiopsis potens]|uniref:DMT family transporter n=1 Tax=Nocardiopsis potens TaxID=1246458 RepID=UPI00034914EE|nr:DMT family transporter [Nocardiopsis potens]